MFTPLCVSSVMISHRGRWIKKAIKPSLIEGEGGKKRVLLCVSLCVYVCVCSVYFNAVLACCCNGAFLPGSVFSFLTLQKLNNGFIWTAKSSLSLSLYLSVCV